MKPITLPLLVNTRVMQNFVGRTKIELDSASVEAVTGRAKDLGVHLKGDTGRAHQVEKMIADTDRRLNSLTELRLEVENLQTSLTMFRDVGLELGIEIEGAIGLEDGQSLSALTDEAGAQLNAIWARINSNFNGDYQFSGAATDTQPLGDLNTFLTEIQTIITSTTPDTFAGIDAALDGYFDDTGLGTTLSTNTYQGSTNAAPTREVSESRRLGPDVKITDTGVRNLLRGLAVMSLADQASSPALTEELKADAGQTLSLAGAQIIDIQSDVGLIQEDIESLVAQHENEKSAYELILLELTGVDQFEAASRMTLLETQLEATYLVTSRIANLSLVNYV